MQTGQEGSLTRIYSFTIVTPHACNREVRSHSMGHPHAIFLCID
jgi:hypothetical protein